jgi:diadenosine tetraphosphatase ApaH/serine/threonine PP2A family protein phosphatase
MRVAVLSDIHGNLVALRAALRVAGDVDAVWVLGDIVGYGPDPNGCVAELRGLANLAAVAGNHDWAAIGRITTEDFNPVAAVAARWTSDQLSSESRAFLAELPSRRTEGDFTLVHGSPRDPIWEYVLDTDVAAENLEHFGTPYCLIGHTHIPSYFLEWEGRMQAEHCAPDRELELGDRRVILNPGSVGQPRDENPDASYLVLDTAAKRAVWRRVPYDIAATQDDMARLGLPELLIQRLAGGW